MVTVIDLITGETETCAAKAEPGRREAMPDRSQPYVLPRLQEHTFAETSSKPDLPLELAQLDCEVFLRAMEER